MGGAFVTLLRKEIHRRQAAFGTSYVLNLLILAVALVAFLILSSLETWSAQVAAIGVGLFLLGTPFIAAIIAFEIWSYEWQGGHRQLLMALPVSGRTVLGVKTVMVVFDSVTFLAGVKALLLIFAWLDPEALPVWLPDGTMAAGGAASSFLHFTVTAVLITLVAALLVQFAWMVGALLSRLHIYIALVAFAAGGWIMLRFASLSGAVLGWLPRAEWWMIGPATVLEEEERAVSATLTWQPEVVEISLAPLVAMAVAGMVLYGVAAHLYDTQIET